MFEDSLVESRVGEVSSSKRWTAVASISLQFAVAGLVIALPLLHPEALPFHIDAPKLLLPLPPKPPAPPVRVQRVAEEASNFASPVPPRAAIISTLLPNRPEATDEEPSLLSPGSGMEVQHGLPSGIIGIGGPHPSVSICSGGSTHSTIKISSGVSQGMLISPIQPVYPSIARAAHGEGVVVVEAIISRRGMIESLHVLSGPVLLQNAAIDAIRRARYKPYQLNGEPTEVQTTITVNFRMNS